MGGRPRAGAEVAPLRSKYRVSASFLGEGRPQVQPRSSQAIEGVLEQTWGFLGSPVVKNLPANQETWEMQV